ncbi:MAG: J domain-containing protein [Isosphaeraceae bacterium]|nr:J domain-containing protein [Isosphaeraceae bacterium]
MSRSGSGKKRERLRGVTELPKLHGEARFRATIGGGKGRQVNLGLYADRWLAAFAYNVGAELLYGDRRPKNEIPASDQPDTHEVRWIAARVRRRLGMDEARTSFEHRPPSTEQLMTLLEITVVPFWRGQIDVGAAQLARELDLAARRLVEAAHVLFWSQESGHPSPQAALERLLALRLDRTFRRGDLTRMVLDDDGDDELRLARWLVYPDELPGGGGFRSAVGQIYTELVEPEPTTAHSALPGWAFILGVAPPFSSEQVRAAYRSRSKSVHPDIGGSQAEFVRLQSAYEEAQRYCAAREL